MRGMFVGEFTPLPDDQQASMPVHEATAAAKGKPPVKDYAQRPLYASAETFDLIRTIAFEHRTTAQAIYREGLLLALQARGLYLDKTPDDI